LRKISPGKLRGLQRLAEENGRLYMLALDQRNSLRRMLKDHGVEPADAKMKEIKLNILKTLSKHVSAVLVDGEYALPEGFKFVHPRTSVILALEKSGYVVDEKNPQDRKSMLFREDAVEMAKRWGCDAVKLLIYWSDAAGQEAKGHQKELVKRVGEETKKWDIPFILEILTYGKNKGGTEAILSAMNVFKEEEYGVDLFKIEAFRERLSPDRIVNASGGKPWVILSGGIDVKDFLSLVSLNCKLGSSGFLAGRVVWKGVVRVAQSAERMELFLRTSGRTVIQWLKKAGSFAIPWYMCPYFGGFEQIEVKGS